MSYSKKCLNINLSNIKQLKSRSATGSNDKSWLLIIPSVNDKDKCPTIIWVKDLLFSCFVFGRFIFGHFSDKANLSLPSKLLGLPFFAHCGTGVSLIEL